MKTLTMLFVFFALLGMNNAQSAASNKRENTLVFEVTTGTCEAKCPCKCPEQQKPKKKKLKKKKTHQWESDGVKTIEVCKDLNHIQISVVNGWIKCTKL